MPGSPRRRPPGTGARATGGRGSRVAAGGVLVAALAALLRPDTRPAVLRAWLVVVVALGTTAVLAAGTFAVTGDPAEQPLWLGFPLVVAQAAGITAAAIAGSGVRDRLTGADFGWRQPAGAAVVVLALLTPVVAGVWWVLEGSGGPLDRGRASDVPAYMSDAVADDPADGVLVVRGSRQAGFTYLLLRRPGVRLGDDAVLPAPLGPGAADPHRGGPRERADPRRRRRLSRAGVAFVYAPAPADPSLVGNLDSVSGVSRGSATGAGSRPGSSRPPPTGPRSASPVTSCAPGCCSCRASPSLVVVVLAAPTGGRRWSADEAPPSSRPSSRRPDRGLLLALLLVLLAAAAVVLTSPAQVPAPVRRASSTGDLVRPPRSPVPTSRRSRGRGRACGWGWHRPSRVCPAARSRGRPARAGPRAGRAGGRAARGPGRGAGARCPGSRPRQDCSRPAPTSPGGRTLGRHRPAPPPRRVVVHRRGCRARPPLHPAAREPGPRPGRRRPARAGPGRRGGHRRQPRRPGGSPHSRKPRRARRRRAADRRPRARRCTPSRGRVVAAVDDSRRDRPDRAAGPGVAGRHRGAVAHPAARRGPRPRPTGAPCWSRTRPASRRSSTSASPARRAPSPRPGWSRSPSRPGRSSSVDLTRAWLHRPAGEPVALRLRSGCPSSRHCGPRRRRPRLRPRWRR